MAGSFQISAPLLTPEAGFIPLDIRLRSQDAVDQAGRQQASTLAHKRGESVAFEQAAKEQRDLLGRWAYGAFAGAWTARPPSSIQIEYAAARHATLDGGAGRSSWHLAYVVAVLEGLFVLPEPALPPGARLWALGEMRGDGFVEVGQHELLDRARIIGGTADARHYLLVHQGDQVWAGQREFLGVLSEMGRFPEALRNVTLLRFRDLDTLRSLLDIDSFDAWDSDLCARRKDAPPPVQPPPKPFISVRAATPPRAAAPLRAATPPQEAAPLRAATPLREAAPLASSGQSGSKPRSPALLFTVLGTVAAAALAAVLVMRRTDPPPPPSSTARVQSSTVLAAVADAGAPPATAPPPPPEPEAPRSASPPRLWGRLPKAEGAAPPKPEAPSPPATRNAGAEQSEAARVIQAKTNLGASLDTAEHRRVQATPVE